MEGKEEEEEDAGAAALKLRSKAPAQGPFAVWLAPGQENAMGAAEAERCVFNQAVKVHVGEVPELSYESTMVVKAFERFSEGMEQVQRSLRLAIYDPSTSCAESVTITGDVELREVVGPQAQHLFDRAPLGSTAGGGSGSGGGGGDDDDREARLLYHVARWRTTLVRGFWSEDLDR